MSRGKGASQRQLRVGEELRHALARILSRASFRDPVLEGAVLTVTEVRAAPDLKSARAFVMPLGGGDTKAIVTALNRAQGYLRGELGREISLRFTPTLVFAADESFDAAQRIEDALKRPGVQRDLHREAPGNDIPEGDGPEG
ncbi:MAG TPA: 30S ribosome-binding factor RbfA [Kiloniellaceae bacterium]|nr:30S ribosome-binding factor RbfA [Kiloniellaceae bacterium]